MLHASRAHKTNQPRPGAELLPVRPMAKLCSNKLLCCMIIAVAAIRLKDGHRMGFLGEGAFFGEPAVLSDSSGSETRSRTVVAVTQCELCFLTKGSMAMLRKQYPELDGRMMRFQRAGTKMSHAQRGRLNQHLVGLQKSLTAAGKGGKLADLFKKQQAKELKAGGAVAGAGASTAGASAAGATVAVDDRMAGLKDSGSFRDKAHASFAARSPHGRTLVEEDPKSLLNLVVPLASHTGSTHLAGGSGAKTAADPAQQLLSTIQLEKIEAGASSADGPLSLSLSLSSNSFCAVC